jgi:hypothetical protein
MGLPTERLHVYRQRQRRGDPVADRFIAREHVVWMRAFWLFLFVGEFRHGLTVAKASAMSSNSATLRA